MTMIIVTVLLLAAALFVAHSVVHEIERKMRKVKRNVRKTFGVRTVRTTRRRPRSARRYKSSW